MQKSKKKNLSLLMSSVFFQNTKSIELGVKNAEFFRIFGHEGGAKYI
jgi:hypothetical protein